MNRETQKSISQWAAETFGEPGSLARVAGRANSEMAELLREATSNGSPEAIAEECADVVIVLFRLADRCGVDLLDEIDRKMAINRTREWVLEGTGCGDHKSGEDFKHVRVK